MEIPDEWLQMTNAELAARLGCSRQAVLSAKRRRQGLCVRCGSPAEPARQYCLKHLIAVRKTRNARNRRVNGFKPWKPGKVGRPPKAAKP